MIFLLDFPVTCLGILLLQIAAFATDLFLEEDFVTFDQVAATSCESVDSDFPQSKPRHLMIELSTFAEYQRIREASGLGPGCAVRSPPRIGARIVSGDEARRYGKNTFPLERVSHSSLSRGVIKRFR